MSEESETRELRRAQEERRAVEAEQAAESESDDEAAQHRRRAEKAEYLREKLQERAESEGEESD